ncbi:unnamed protein product [Rotaria sp. Silwood1]|nr:unnamed protein product [Rotaria sp. Silwood1]CAF1660347.1 unnamed protein product [Rotaria sp. Silwood1]
MFNLSSIWETKDLVKEFRAHVQQSMLDEKSAWRWIYWAIMNITESVRSLSAWPPRQKEQTRNQLHHTESD